MHNLPAEQLMRIRSIRGHDSRRALPEIFAMMDIKDIPAEAVESIDEIAPVGRRIGGRIR